MDDKIVKNNQLLYGNNPNYDNKKEENLMYGQYNHAYPLPPKALPIGTNEHAEKIDENNRGHRNENSYHFVTEVEEEVVDENPNWTKTLQTKPYPHLNAVEDWKFWKDSMLTMKPNMKNNSKILALYMHCHLQ